MRTKITLLLSLLAILTFAAESRSASYGYSLIELDDTNPNAPLRIYAESGTVLDYATWYWYDPGIQAFMFQNNVPIDSTGIEINPNGSYIYAWIDFQANYGMTYKIHGDHYLRSIDYYVSGGQTWWRDIYGFNFYSGNFPSPYPFTPGSQVWYTYRLYRAATTNVSVSVQRPLQLNSIDTAGGVPGQNFLTTLRGTGLFGDGQNLQITGNGVNVSIRPGQLPNTIEVLEIEVQIAQDAQVGPRELRLSVNGQTSNPLTFRVGDNSPVISNISPDIGDAGDEIAVTITGSHFGLNPEIEIEGLGVARAINSSTSTEINAIFAVSETADPGTRGVKVRSRGVTGNGFEQVPGNSSISNPVPFNVNAANPSVELPEIGSVMKGSFVTITVRTRNAPANHVTRLRFKNQTARIENNKWVTGEARFIDASDQDVTEISYTGDEQQQIRIRGWERSSSKDNIKLEARFNDDSRVRKDKSFSVSSVELSEESECTGYDGVEFERQNSYHDRFFYVPKAGNNRLRAKIVPSGTTGNFVLEPSEANITLSHSTVSSTNSLLITVSANANATRHPGISVKAANPNSLTREAEQLRVEVLPRKEKNVVIYAVTEENDDVRVIPPGQGQPNTVAYVFSPGSNGFIDTVAQGDDWLAPVPIGQRPPGYDARSRRVFTGENGILETMPEGDDEIFTSDSKEEMRLYAPISEFGTGQAEAVCITSGANRFLDTLPNPRSDDVEREDPNDPSLRVITAGPNGRCNTDANRTNVPPPALPNVQGLQDYLNNTTWGRQSNIFFTVTVGSPFTVNFDLNRNGELRDPRDSTDEAYAIKNFRRDPNAYNLYYMGMRIEEFQGGRLAAVAEHNSDTGEGNGWFGTDGLSNQTTAHELGHMLGRNGHSPTGETYWRDLMYPSIVSTVNQCRVREPDWNLVHR